MAKFLKSKKLGVLKKYFKKEDSVVLSFLFGSQVKGYDRKVSDWDIGIYFKPKEYLELETGDDYPRENKIWSDLIDILGTDDVDLVVLNRARPDLVWTVLKDGFPLKMADKKLYWDLFCKTSYEAIDWWQFALEFWEIGEKAKSLTNEAKVKIAERLRFLNKEWEEFKKFKEMKWFEYNQDSDKRRSIERWVENLVMASLDIAKIILASEKKNIPESYKDTLKIFTILNLHFSEKQGKKFSEFAKLRNIAVHEYLDIKWEKIKNFIKEGEKLYPKFIEKIKKMFLL